MKKIRMMAVFTVMALAASFAGHAQTTKAPVQKAPASKDQTVAPAKQTKSTTTTTTSTSTSTTTAKSSTATTHKAHKKPVNGTAKPAPTVKAKAPAPATSHFAPRKVMKGKHKKGHHSDAKKAPTGDGK